MLFGSHDNAGTMQLYKFQNWTCARQGSFTLELATPSDGVELEVKFSCAHHCKSIYSYAGLANLLCQKGKVGKVTI